MTHEIEVQPWLERMLKGDTGAFREMYAHIHPHVYRTVSFMAGSKDDIGDIVNEVYIALFQALPTYKPDQPFRPWLNGIIARQTSNWRRRLWRRMRLADRNRTLFVEPPRTEPGDGLFEAEQNKELLQHVGRLSLRLRQIIVLRYYQDHSYVEIADVLDIPVGTVKSRHHAAIAKLRRLMEQNPATTAAAASNIGEGAGRHVHS
ncbi:sigma-70 family RNA polymerase sigma factor [Paenibacillus sp. PR3]|uniref:Sigma-70 family RNA polymerase sigma factor n=1 Tax=Paenibacillus terricola TaxID=2763503 RepID=A0ABR8MXC1_9BACL|nr:sigma-70 family RNA polymerase sigma factor [Paenibacillus terricola]MBD3920592.1 sigma-70 family RNA polymerase sigma factor [Paenibacillus terricola]